MGPGSFFDASVTWVCAFSHPFQNDILLQKIIFFLPWTNFGQFLALFWGLLQIFSITLTILEFSPKNEQKSQLLQNMAYKYFIYLKRKVKLFRI